MLSHSAGHDAADMQTEDCRKRETCVELLSLEGDASRVPIGVMGTQPFPAVEILGSSYPNFGPLHGCLQPS